jgi:DUF218 domain
MSKDLAKQVYAFFCSQYVSRSDLKLADALFIFARNVRDLACEAHEIYAKRLVQQILVTGGIGKDSGDLPKLGLSEAHYLTALMYDFGVSADDILVESKATNGGENSRFGMQMIRDAGIESERMRIILLTHPSNGLRVLAVHTLEARKLGFTADYQLAACDWDFDENDVVQQKMLLSECLRLIEWPQHKNAAGELDPWADQINVPADLYREVLAWKAAQSK